MTGLTMGRRKFIALSLTALGSSAFGNMAWSKAITSGAASLATFYDRRYPMAVAMANQLSSGGPLIAMDSDPTHIATHLLTGSSASGAAPTMQGITLQSVPFCLAQIRRRQPVMLQQLDIDLVFWQI